MSNEDFENKIQDRNLMIEQRIKCNQMARKVRRSKLLIQQVRALLAFCLAIALCFGLYRFAKCHYWYLISNVFDDPEHNHRVQIEGNLITPNYKIYEALRNVTLPHLPIYLIDTKEMEHNIELLEPVKKAYIRRFGFPARFVIRIDERIPVLTISPNENVHPIAFFTSCGKLISYTYMPLSPEYKTYLVLSYGRRGDDYYNWDVKKVNSILYLAKEMERLSGEHVKYIDLRNPKDIYVKLDSALVRIGENDETLYTRIKNIGSILPSLSKLKNKKIKYIDLRWETNYLKIDSHPSAGATEE